MKTSATVAEAAQKLAEKSDQLAKRTAEMGLPQFVIDRGRGLVFSDALFFGIEKGVPTMMHLDFVQGKFSKGPQVYTPRRRNSVC